MKASPHDRLAAIGETQVAFRDRNEVIQASADRFTLFGPVPFICECAEETCVDVVQLTFDQYEAIRQHPRRFFNVSGHEATSVDSGAERIVVVAGELTVVEKIGVAGDVASVTYPRA